MASYFLCSVNDKHLNFRYMNICAKTKQKSKKFQHVNQGRRWKQIGDTNPVKQLGSEH